MRILICSVICKITPVYFAVYNNNLEMVNYYLNKKAKINYQDFVGRSPLYVAVRDGYTKIVKRLIDYGANPYFAEKSEGRNLLHIAAANGRKEIAGILLKNGMDINARDNQGYTPLDYALKHHHSSVVEFLLEKKGLNNKHKKNKVNNLEIQNEKEAYIVKLRNKTWGVRTKSGFITFDYHKTGTLPSNPSVFNGCINPDEWKGVPFYQIDGGFSSNKTLYEKENEFDSIHFVFNYRYQGHYNRTKPFELTNLYFPEENKSTTINEIKVTPLPGYRQSQKSYFIEADGLNILWLYRHSARYQPWKKNTEAIKYLKKNNKQIDLMFVGNPNTDNGPEWMSIMEEAYEMSKDLNINAVFPIPTCKMGEYFCNERKRKGDGENIYHAINPGDFFFYKENQIIK